MEEGAPLPNTVEQCIFNFLVQVTFSIDFGKHGLGKKLQRWNLCFHFRIFRTTVQGIDPFYYHLVHKCWCHGKALYGTRTCGIWCSSFLGNAKSHFSFSGKKNQGKCAFKKSEILAIKTIKNECCSNFHEAFSPS